MDIEDIDVILEYEADKLYEAALNIIQPFWDEHAKRRKGPREHRGYHGVRVRPRKVGISAVWFRTQFYKDHQGEPKRINIEIPRGRGYKYTAGQFRAMKPWERRMALEIEKQLGLIRFQSDALVRLSKIAKAYQKRQRKLEQELGLEEEEEMADNTEMDV